MVPVGPALHADIPVDVPNANVFLSKEASTNIAAIGDFVQYRIGIENDNGIFPPGMQLVDTLPRGFRFQSGSLRIDGDSPGDPAIGPDGRSLLIDLPSGEVTDTSIRYVTEVRENKPHFLKIG